MIISDICIKYDIFGRIVSFKLYEILTDFL